MVRRWAVLVAAALVAGLLVAGLLATAGGSDGGSPRVYAAASLRGVLPELDDRPLYSFAGSGQLLRQIEAGAPADVFAAASPEEPAALHAAGRCTPPRPFATNRLALLVPAGNPGRIETVRDLARRGRRVAIGTRGVPVGRAARAALERSGVRLDRAIVSSETSVSGVVAKVALGSADVGLGYVTDAGVAGGRVEAVALPAAARPAVEYHVCAVLRPGADRAGAEEFIGELTAPRGRAALRRAGFGVPR